MTGSTERQRLLICCSVSILLHIGLLTCGIALLIKRASFQVEAGQTSAEIDFVIESVPVPATTHAAACTSDTSIGAIRLPSSYP
jgi:hypothetical protein